MKPIEEVFIIHRARSGLFSDYESGAVAYVGNGLGDNAVVGFVKPLRADKVFKFRGIAISAFCEATVQAPPFIACGRAGNGLVVLEPREPMTPGQLSYFAAYINKALRWRFNWYRQTTADRLRRLPVPDSAPDLSFDVGGSLPELTTQKRLNIRLKLKPIVLGSIYELVAGDYHNASDLRRGDVPLVSCGDANNGIMAFVDVPQEHIHSHRLTIAFNGMNTLTAKYHPYPFATKDDVAICETRQPLRLSTEVFIQLMLNRERWRYSYFRKCYVDKLRRFTIALPLRDGQLDEDTMETILAAHPYWQFLKTRLERPEQ